MTYTGGFTRMFWPARVEAGQDIKVDIDFQLNYVGVNAGSTLVIVADIPGLARYIIFEKSYLVGTPYLWNGNFNLGPAPNKPGTYNVSVNLFVSPKYGAKFSWADYDAWRLPPYPPLGEFETPDGIGGVRKQDFIIAPPQVITTPPSGGLIGARTQSINFRVNPSEAGYVLVSPPSIEGKEKFSHGEQGNWNKGDYITMKAICNSGECSFEEWGAGWLGWRTVLDNPISDQINENWTVSARFTTPDDGGINWPEFPGLPDFEIPKWAPYAVGGVGALILILAIRR